MPHVFGDHMVLQRERKAPVWGWAGSNETIVVSIGGKTVKATADAAGRWMTRLPSFKAGGPYMMTIRSSTQTRTFTNVMFGEVWICSGQSNMEWPLKAAAGGPAAIAAANYPQFRLFHVPRLASVNPSNDVSATWEICSSTNVSGFSAVGFYFGREIHQKLNVPVGMIQSAWGGTRIEPWTPPEGFLQPVITNIEKGNKAALQSYPMALYNGMIHGLVPYAIRGALWYQGEANIADGDDYARKMRELIGGWRKVWKQGDFPFYYVQLAAFGYNKPGALPMIWEAQSSVLTFPKTGMAVITDISNLHNIHPANKEDVGHRLALWALAKDYRQRGVVYSGPLYSKMRVEGKYIRIFFNHAKGGLMTRNGDGPNWFSIAGDDQNFLCAQTKIDGETVLVWHDGISHPAAVRFAWHEFAQPNLINKAGLPASSFRTDGGDPTLTLPPEAMTPGNPEWSWQAMRKTLQLDRIDLTTATTSTPKVFQCDLRNMSPEPLVINYQWLLAGSSWDIQPATGTLTVSPSGTVPFKAEIKMNADTLSPFPVFKAVLKIGNHPSSEFQEPLAPIITRQAVAVRLSKAPVLDGRIDADEYAGATPQGHFYEYTGGKYSAVKTSFVAGYTDKALYIALRGDEPHPEHIKATTTKRDGEIWSDDDAEIFLDPNRTLKDYYQMAVNVAGVQYDVKGGPNKGKFGDRAWNGKWNTAITTNGSEIMVEFEIPFATLGTATPRPGDKWGANVCRTRGAVDRPTADLSSWSLLYSNFHQIRNFGIIEFH